jgi:two-component system response regulator RegX3
MTVGGTVLIVEDDENLRTVLAHSLRAREIEVVEAASAEDAVAALGRGLRPRLVLLDLHLPGANGWDFLREEGLANAGSPPVVITSAASVSPRRLAEARVAGYLPKPFALDAFLATVKRFVGAAR